MLSWHHAFLAAAALVVAVPVLADSHSQESSSATLTPTPLVFKESGSDVSFLVVAHADNFEDAAAGVLPEAGLDPVSVSRRYEGGEYVLAKNDPMSTQIASTDIPGIYDHATVNLDVRLVGDTFGRSIAIGCRRQADSSHYRLTLFPDTGEFLLARWDVSTRVTLAGTITPAMNLENLSNHVELGCVEQFIWVRINDQLVADVEDHTYDQGRMWIGVYGSAVAADARFDNLVVRRLEVVPHTPTPVELTSTPEPTVTPTPSLTPIPTAEAQPEASPLPTATAIATVTPTPPPALTSPGTSRFDGQWSSQARADHALSFSVRSDNIVSLDLTFLATSVDCMVDGRFAGLTVSPAPIDRGEFSLHASRPAVFQSSRDGEPSVDGSITVSLLGRFGSPSSANGTGTVTVDLPLAGGRCNATQRLSWSATRLEQVPQSELTSAAQGIVFVRR